MDVLKSLWAIVDWWQTVNVLKTHYRQWHRLWVGGMNSRRIWPKWSVLTFPLITNRGERNKKTKWSVCKQIKQGWAQLIKSLFNYGLTTCRSKLHLYPQWSRHCGCKVFRSLSHQLTIYVIVYDGLWVH